MERTAAIGPLILAGSGEYTPTMDIVDRFFIDRVGNRPILLIATSCAQEGLDRMTWWEDLGVKHFRNLGVEATPLRIVDHDDADQREPADRIASAGFVWFSGGSPPYLAQSFYETASFRALEAANRGGAVVAGSSGGLGVLNAHIDFPGQPGVSGLGLSAPIRAMAHFDRAEQRRPEMIERTVSNLEPGQVAVGVDEDTALVWVDGGWQAMGHKRVVVYNRDLTRTIFHHGDRVDILPPPARTQLPPD